MHSVRTRIERLEKKCRIEQDYVLVPINEAGTVARLPRRWVNFLAEKQRERDAAGDCDNLTDKLCGLPKGPAAGMEVAL